MERTVRVVLRDQPVLSLGLRVRYLSHLRLDEANDVLVLKYHLGVAEQLLLHVPRSRIELVENLDGDDLLFAILSLPLRLPDGAEPPSAYHVLQGKIEEYIVVQGRAERWRPIQRLGFAVFGAEVKTGRICVARDGTDTVCVLSTDLYDQGKHGRRCQDNADESTNGDGTNDEWFQVHLFLYAVSICRLESCQKVKKEKLFDLGSRQ